MNWPLPPEYLRKLPLPRWERGEREKYEPPGHVWDCDRQRWVKG